MRRREFISLLSGAAAWPLVAPAQQASMPVIGALQAVSAAQWRERMAGFHQGLAETGFVERRNIAIEYRWADGVFERLPSMAADLVARKVAVLFAGAGDVGIRAAIAATKTIPIVFHTAADPVDAGFVASLSRPGGNVTGITVLGHELMAKRLELLHDLLPGAPRIAMLVNPNNPGTPTIIQSSQAAARRLGIELVILDGGSESQIESAITTAVQQQVGALSIASDAYLNSHNRQVAFLALRHALPTISNTRENVSSGILMSYGPDQSDSYRQAGAYIGRVLKGEKAGDLPVMQPTMFDLFINLTTAKAIGLKLPESFFLRATEVID
jgi:putative tryptophan/tyrosine transport system substrate-binding protein